MHRDAEARFVEGLHGRRQHQQGPGAPSLAHGRREAGLSVLREDPEGGQRHRLRAQGPLSAVGRAALAASHALRDGRRCRQGGEGLAADPLRRSTTRPIAGPAAPAPRPDGYDQFEKTGRVDWTSDLAEIPGQVRRQQRLRRPRPDLRPDHGDRAAPLRRADGHADQGHGRRPCRVGHRRGVDRRAAMADRGAAPARDPRGHAEEVRLRRARQRRRPGQARDLRRELGEDVQATTSRRPPGATTASPRSSRTTSAPAANPRTCATGSSFPRDAIRHRRLRTDRTAAGGTHAGRRRRSGAARASAEAAALVGRAAGLHDRSRRSSRVGPAVVDRMRLRVDAGRDRAR